MARYLSPDEAKAFYDGFGKKQDAQAFYEDHALDVLLTRSKLEAAAVVVEFGCGTGRVAERLFQNYLGEGCSYLGVDVSSTMVELAQQRLEPWADRAVVKQTTGEIRLPVEDQSVDRVLTTYVVDLLGPTEIDGFLNESYRALRTGGLLCVAGLTHGRGLSRAVSAGWTMLHRIAPRVVGGCRPLRLREVLSADRWRLEHCQVVSSYLIASEVIVAAAVRG